MSSQKHLTLTIPQFPDFKIFIHKFSNVQNAPIIKENLLKGNELYNFSFINSKTIISIEQLAAAVYRTLLDFTNDKIRTRTIHSEVIFSLSPTQNIMEALKKFGIQDDNSDLVVARFAQTPEEENYDLSVIDGVEVEVDDEQFKQSVDVGLLQKYYKLNSEDQDQLVRQIVSAIQLRGH